MLMRSGFPIILFVVSVYRFKDGGRTTMRRNGLHKNYILAGFLFLLLFLFLCYFLKK